MSFYVAGIGFSSQATAEEIVTLVRASLAELPAADLFELATLERKARATVLRDAATALGAAVRPVAAGVLAAVPVPNPSRQVAERVGIASIAEAAALSRGRLLLEKRRSAHATCAIALCEAK